MLKVFESEFTVQHLRARRWAAQELAEPQSRTHDCLCFCFVIFLRLTYLISVRFISNERDRFRLDVLVIDAD